MEIDTQQLQQQVEIHLGYIEQQVFADNGEEVAALATNETAISDLLLDLDTRAPIVLNNLLELAASGISTQVYDSYLQRYRTTLDLSSSLSTRQLSFEGAVKAAYVATSLSSRTAADFSPAWTDLHAEKRSQMDSAGGLVEYNTHWNEISPEAKGRSFLGFMRLGLAEIELSMLGVEQYDIYALDQYIQIVNEAETVTMLFNEELTRSEATFDPAYEYECIALFQRLATVRKLYKMATNSVWPERKAA